jgi:GTPase Era involved in 16S rRNA processing
MNNKIYKIFEDVESKAEMLGKYWNNFSTEISQHLPDSRYQPEMQELSEKLDRAIKKLINEIRSPTLTLATTGTTSSGKSTLVNLLCGAEIVPVAVSEMSAGAVTVEYSDTKSLIIHETPGALWEYGEWRNISEEEIYQRLYQVMISYIENREKQINLACPQSTIYYPFKFYQEFRQELPQNTRVQILDLPGLAYVGDEGNANVIKQCREALCIVTYNSAETDSQKVKSLLQEVVQQVKDLGGSPARMLFILNRIDVFRADKNWPETENRFVEKAISDIKNELTQQLREYTEDIDNLQVVKLSTWPALLSLQIQNDRDIYSAEACKKADNHFNGLIEEILEDLPRNTQKWERHDRNRVAVALWQKSYGEEFQQELRKHITKNFPQLVIPQIIERFNIAAGNSITEWSTQTTAAILNSSSERYQLECENISRIREALKSFLEESDKSLKRPFEKLDAKVKQVIAKESEDDVVNYIRTIILELQNNQPYNQLGEKLYPVYSWESEFQKGINQVLEAVAESLETGKVKLDSPNLKKANVVNVNLLERNLNRLINSGYTSEVAKKGETREAKTDTEKKQLKQINEELNELGIHLNIVIKDILKQISTQELNRIYQAVSELFRCHLSYIEESANNLAPDIGIKLPNSEMIKVDSNLTFDFSFEAGFPITEGTWEEEIKVEKRKRAWYKLWIGKRSVYETEYKIRSSDNAELPSVENLLTNWIIQAKEQESERVNQIAGWLLKQIDSLKKNVDKIQNDIIDRYQERLDKAHEEITIDYEQQRSIWIPMQQKAQELASEFSQLENYWKSNN